jgi:hypothetical protein
LQYQYFRFLECNRVPGIISKAVLSHFEKSCIIKSDRSFYKPGKKYSETDLVIPIGDDNRARRTFPGVTYALILINAIVFFMELAYGEAFIETWSFIPARFLTSPGADFITIFSSMFMHAGWLHIIGNMLYLFIFGDNVEDTFGHFRFLIFYLLCGVAATFAHLAFNTDSTLPSLGPRGLLPEYWQPIFLCSLWRGSPC